MRFILRSGSRELLVFSRNRFIQFHDLRMTANFVRGYLDDPSNLKRLRSAMRVSPRYAYLADVPRIDLADRIASMLVRGELRMMAEPRVSVPWAWPYQIAPSVPGSGGGGPGRDFTYEDQPRPLGEEEEQDDTPPTAVVPPAYPNIAKIEGDCLIQGTVVFGLSMETMKFTGMGVLDESEVGPLFGALAANQGSQLTDSVEIMGFELSLLAGADLPPAKDTELGFVYTGMVGQQKLALLGVVDDLVDALQPLRGGEATRGPESDVARVFPQLAASQRNALTRLADETLHALAPHVLGEPNFTDLDSQVAVLFAAHAEQAGAALSRIASSFGDTLGQLTAAADLSVFGGDSTVGTTFQNLAATQADDLGAAAAQLGGAMARITGEADFDEPTPSALAGALADMAEDQQTELSNAAKRVGQALETLEAADDG